MNTNESLQASEGSEDGKGRLLTTISRKEKLASYFFATFVAAFLQRTLESRNINEGRDHFNLCSK